MEPNEKREDLVLTRDRDSRIEVVVNQPGADTVTEINLLRVFRNMKRRFRVFIWVILLCFTVGICAPLLMYQLDQKPLTVSSVVTLEYDVVKRNSAGLIVSSTPVADLTAPNGEALDLNQLTSSYVLQAALDGAELSRPISLENLRNNIRIDRILAEDSRRQLEVASQMMADKNTGAYSQVQNIDLTYVNRFVVSLTNGFGSADSRSKTELTNAELRLVLDRILYAYNDYLVNTYADIKLPDDEFSAIDIEKQDILDSLDMLRTAVQDLYDFCSVKPAAIRHYRSWRTGYSLNDLMAELETARTVNVNYLNSYVSTHSIVRDRDAMITNYRYQLRNAQTRLDTLNENIRTVQNILDNYKNDEIFVSMQESDTARATRTTTDYYNKLVLEQADNYDRAAKLEVKIADLQYKLDSLTAAAEAGAEAYGQEQATRELADALEVCRRVYARIRDHFEEIHSSAFFTTYAEHTVAQGKVVSFLSACAKKMVIGGVGGAVIGGALWFLSGIAAEFRGRKEEDAGGKGEAEG